MLMLGLNCEYRRKCHWGQLSVLEHLKDNLTKSLLKESLPIFLADEEHILHTIRSQLEAARGGLLLLTRREGRKGQGGREVSKVQTHQQEN